MQIGPPGTHPRFVELSGILLCGASTLLLFPIVWIPGLLWCSGYLVGVRLSGECSFGDTTATGGRLGATNSRNVAPHLVHIRYCSAIVHFQENLDVVSVFDK